jgi:DNA mismatch repair ATPase MutS
MRFIADKQTLEDLNIFGKYKSNSLYSLFNQVHTRGGEKLLDAMFHNPLSDPEAINQRCMGFQYFQKRALVFPIANESFSVMENYLGASGDGNFLLSIMNVFRKKLMASIARDEQYHILQTGLLTTIEVLNTVYDFILDIAGGQQDPENPWQDELNQIQKIFTHRKLGWLTKARGAKHISVLTLARYDHLLRSVLGQEMRSLLESLYLLDVCIAVGNTAKIKGLSYAQAFPKGSNRVRALALSHPCLKNAVPNPVSLYQDSNVLFLTGANMAGKSTFMKTFGISIYLAHMGFPVAAKEMEFSIMDGIYSSINVPDDLSRGYSHFYAEVLRVKKVAEEVSRSKNLLVIFDELFKGTNVKDAFDATLAVTEAFPNTGTAFSSSLHIS